MDELKDLLTTKLSYLISIVFVWFMEDPLKAIGAIGGIVILFLTAWIKILTIKKLNRENEGK